MGKINLPYVNSFKDRHGQWHYYYRRDGLRIVLPREDVASSYARVHAQFETKTSAVPTGTRTGTFGALVAAYFASADLNGLRASTQEEYRRLISRLDEKMHDLLLTQINRPDLLTVRDAWAKQASNVTANNKMKTLNILFNFGVERGLLTTNPITKLKGLKETGLGWQPWTEDQLATWTRLSEGPIRIAFMLALYTGQRRGDILKMRWTQIVDDLLTLTQGKTTKFLVIPVHPRLQKELILWKASRTVTGPVIVHRADGKPYTDSGFSSLWHYEQHRLGVLAPFHGLRKNATIALIEAGCSPAEAQAITGHETLDMLRGEGRGHPAHVGLRRGLLGAPGRQGGGLPQAWARGPPEAG